jgi:hypothetical protein
VHCEEYKKTLQRDGLLPDDSINRLRQLQFVAAVLVLVLIGGVKIVVALQRGRTNLAFLIILIIVAIVVAAKVAFPRLTSAGQAMLTDIQNLYSGLKDRAFSIHPGGATIEASMLAAAFGLGALEGSSFLYAQTLFPHQKKSSSSWWSSSNSSCGSAGCGSSCSSGCGSSCGGGCGGGCGGCGS